MKLKVFPAIIGLISVITCFSIIKVATAQTALSEQNTEPVSLEEKKSEWMALDIEESRVCDRVFEEEANVWFEGNPFFDDFQGIILTEEQQSAYDALDAQTEARRGEVYQNALSILDPTAILSFSYNSNSVSEDVQTAVQAALNKNPTIDQKEALDREFAQYGEFSVSYIVYVSPDQDAQVAQITEDFYAQVKDIMTPEQLPQYRKNLESRLRINEVCDGWTYVPVDQGLGRVLVGLSSAPMGRLVDTIPELGI